MDPRQTTLEKIKRLTFFEDETDGEAEALDPKH
jgi:hypothetical protein